ncbi:hypothetical protein GOODEAATRI_005861 [Goodea atripinnis]|uniref:Uncharacterized protein n=1 Tax=Goodea atripinnis TaxID=208336 RepID=A0ABV0P3R0_9TELE
MVFHNEQYELSAAYEDVSNRLYASEDVWKKYSDESSKVTSATFDLVSSQPQTSTNTAGVQRYKVGTVTFGLLCLLLSILIIYLVLSTATHHNTLTGEKNELMEANFDLQDSYQNVSKEQDELRRNLTKLVSLHYSLTEERDGLKKINFGIEASLKNLTEEREKLKSGLNNFNIEANSKNLKEEKDELKRKLNDLASEANLLTNERDTLKRMNSVIKANNKNLTEDRDALRNDIKKFNIEANNKNLKEERDELKKNVNVLG